MGKWAYRVQGNIFQMEPNTSKLNTNHNTIYKRKGLFLINCRNHFEDFLK